MKSIEELNIQYENIEKLEEETGEDLTQEKQKICDQIYYILNEKKKKGKIV